MHLVLLKKRAARRNHPSHPEMSYDEGSLKYLQNITRLIEGRFVGRDEILELLEKIVRQRRMVKRQKVLYDFQIPRGTGP